MFPTNKKRKTQKGFRAQEPHRVLLGFHGTHPGPRMGQCGLKVSEDIVCWEQVIRVRKVRSRNQKEPLLMEG